MLRALVRSILMPLTSHIASLNRHTPKFSGIRLKLTWCQPFAVQGLPKSSNPDSCPPKKRRFWEVLFCTKSIFQAKRSIFTYSMSRIFWKLLSSFGISWDPLGTSCDPSDFSKHCGSLKPCHVIKQAWRTWAWVSSRLENVKRLRNDMSILWMVKRKIISKQFAFSENHISSHFESLSYE